MWAASEANRACGHLNTLSSASQQGQHKVPQWRACLDELRWGKRRVRDALLQEWRGEEVGLSKFAAGGKPRLPRSRKRAETRSCCSAAVPTKQSARRKATLIHHRHYLQTGLAIGVALNCLQTSSSCPFYEPPGVCKADLVNESTLVSAHP